MAEFSDAIRLLESKSGLFSESGQSVLKEFNSGKSTLSQAIKETEENNEEESNNEPTQDNDEFVETIAKAVFKECENMKTSFKQLCSVENEAKRFEKMERKAREKVYFKSTQ